MLFPFVLIAPESSALMTVSKTGADEGQNYAIRTKEQQDQQSANGMS
jgi:hypothetical protein